MRNPYESAKGTNTVMVNVPTANSTNDTINNSNVTMEENEMMNTTMNTMNTTATTTDTTTKRRVSPEFNNRILETNRHYDEVMMKMCDVMEHYNYTLEDIQDRISSDQEAIVGYNIMFDEFEHIIDNCNIENYVCDTGITRQMLCDYGIDNKIRTGETLCIKKHYKYDDILEIGTVEYKDGKQWKWDAIGYMIKDFPKLVGISTLSDTYIYKNKYSNPRAFNNCDDVISYFLDYQYEIEDTIIENLDIELNKRLNDIINSKIASDNDMFKAVGRRFRQRRMGVIDQYTNTNANEDNQ